MNINLFDDEQITHLYPLTLTRPAGDLRCGIYTVAEKWKNHLNADAVGFETRDYLSTKFKSVSADIHINGRWLPDAEAVAAINALHAGQKLIWNDIVLASCGSNISEISYPTQPNLLNRPYDIFLSLATEIQKDFDQITAGRQSQLLSETNTKLGSYHVFAEEGAKIECCVLNATQGPIYIGKNAEIMEGSLIRGPFAMGEGSVVKLGSKVYGPTALGPYCVAGGEISNISMQAFSNKGHDGFLGNAVLGEWCNIGADTNCSNLKNNYENVKVWNYDSGRFEKSENQFCGLIMGDHSKCGINTMFNTGTVVGVSANIFGAGFPRQFVPDFAWGGAAGFITYKPDAAFKTAELVMPRRKKVFDEVEKAIMEQVFELTAGWRNWE